jgi:hypothetical protein
MKTGPTPITRESSLAAAYFTPKRKNAWYSVVLRIPRITNVGTHPLGKVKECSRDHKIARNTGITIA